MISCFGSNVSCFYSLWVYDSCGITHTLFNAWILFNNYLLFTWAVEHHPGRYFSHCFRLSEVHLNLKAAGDIIVEVQLIFTLPGTFELTQLIFAVVCAPVAPRGELWEVSVASGPCSGAQLLLCLAGRRHWWCWDFPLAAQFCPALSTQLPRAPSACLCCACSARPAQCLADGLLQTGSLVSGLSTCLHNTCFGSTYTDFCKHINLVLRRGLRENFCNYCEELVCLFSCDWIHCLENWSCI